jgi:hypothetical protein
VVAAALGGRVAELGRAVAVRDRVVAMVAGSIAGLAELCGRCVAAAGTGTDGWYWD